MLLAESFLEHNSWVPGAAIAIVGLLINWLWRRRDRKTKAFDYCVLSDVAILSHRPDDEFLKVTYMGEELDNPRIVRVRFANTGTEVIRASEVLDQFVLTVNAQVVSASIAEQSSRDLAGFKLAVPNFPVCEVRLTLATLNPGDNFTLQLLVDSKDKADISLSSGRIEGESRKPGIYTTAAEKHDLTTDLTRKLFMFVGTVGLGTWILLGPLSDTPIQVMFGWFFVAIGLFSGLAACITYVDLRRSLAKGLFLSNDGA